MTWAEVDEARRRTDGARLHSYRFAPRDRRGLVFGVRTSQAAVVAVMLVITVGELRLLHGSIRALIAVQLVIGLAVAFVPVRGRPLEQWLPVVARFSSRALTGARRVVPVAGRVPTDTRRRTPFAPFEVVEIPGESGGVLGALADRRAGTLTAAIVVAGEAFALLDDEGREHRIGRWSSVLAALGSGPNAPWRVQWIERTVPDRREAMQRRLAVAFSQAELSETIDTGLIAAQSSYAALVDQESIGAIRHELVVTVTVRVHGRPVRSVEASSELHPSGQALVGALVSLERRCRDAGVGVEGALSPVGLRSYLARTFIATPLDVPSRNPWPFACEATWASFRTDATWHATYWVAEWPRHAVGSDFLLPLLNDKGERRALSVVMEPVAFERASRRAESARTAARADTELRHRHGFALTARTSREQEAVVRREEELAAGHAGYRFSGYLSVTAQSASELEQSCGRLEQAAALSQLDLRRVYGAQAESFLCTLPLGRGCR